MKKFIKRGAILLFLLGFVPVVMAMVFDVDVDARLVNIHSVVMSVVGGFCFALAFLVFCAMNEKTSSRILVFTIELVIFIAWLIFLYRYMFG